MWKECSQIELTSIIVSLSIPPFEMPFFFILKHGRESIEKKMMYISCVQKKKKRKRSFSNKVPSIIIMFSPNGFILDPPPLSEVLRRMLAAFLRSMKAAVKSRDAIVFEKEVGG